MLKYTVNFSQNFLHPSCPKHRVVAALGWLLHPWAWLAPSLVTCLISGLIYFWPFTSSDPLHTSDHPVLSGSRALAVSDTSLACRTPRSSSVLHYWFVTICRCFQWSKLEMNEWMSLVYLCGWGDMCVCACDGRQPQGCQPAPLGQVLIGLELTQWTRLLGDGAWAVFLSLPPQSWITIMCVQHFLPSFWWLDSVLCACEAREHFINWTISLVFTF